MGQIKNLSRKIFHNQLAGPIFALILLLLFNLIFTKDFFTIEIKDGHLYGSLIDILNRGSILMILAIGMTLVIATGGIDISVGSVLAIAGTLAATMMGQNMGATDVALPLVLLAVLGISLFCGIWNGFLVAKLGLQPVVATLILLTAGRGIAQLISNGNVLTIYYEPYFYMGTGFLFGLPFSIFIVVGVLLLIMLFVRKTAFGLFLESVGINAEASRFSGLNIQRITLIAYAICGLCAGIAGIITTSEIKSADANNMGMFIELDAILSVALAGNKMTGGRFSLPASVIGALVIQTLTTTIYASGVPPKVIMLVKAIVVIAIMITQSEDFKKTLARFKGRTRDKEVQSV
jgi:ribose/xylose/arabinose/galactoside ABC-type transport system permease subunit